MSPELVRDLMQQVHLLEQRVTRLRAENLRLRAALEAANPSLL